MRSQHQNDTSLGPGDKYFWHLQFQTKLLGLNKVIRKDQVGTELWDMGDDDASLSGHIPTVSPWVSWALLGPN